jgi:hypothetical protein
VSWPKYARKVLGVADFEEMTHSQDRVRNAVGQPITWRRQWWVYFGVVSLSMFTVVDYADPVRRAEAAVHCFCFIGKAAEEKCAALEERSPPKLRFRIGGPITASNREGN